MKVVDSDLSPPEIGGSRVMGLLTTAVARLMNNMGVDRCPANLSLCEDAQLRHVLVRLAATRPSAKQNNRGHNFKTQTNSLCSL